MNAPVDVNNIQLGGRFIPRSLADPKKLPKLVKALKTIVNSGAIVSGLGVNANKKPVAPNSVNPEWRKALFLGVVGTYVLLLRSSQLRLTLSQYVGQQKYDA